MKICVCSTPIQIINIINLAIQKNFISHVDLIILDHAEQNVYYYEKLKQLNLFNSILFVKSRHMTGGNSSQKIIRYFNTVRHYLNRYSIIEQINKQKVYKQFFICSPDIPSQIIYYFYKKKNVDMQLYMLEEGTFAYSYFLHQYTGTKRLFTKILFGRDMTKDYNGIFVYKPNYMIGHGDISVYQIDNLDSKDDKIKRILNEVFNAKDLAMGKYPHKFIYFDQPYQFESINSRINSLINIIYNDILKDNLILKLHPRTIIGTYDRDISILETKLPLELINLNHDLNNYTLISVFSTACLTPKIMFNQEPNVILLYKLINLEQISTITEDTYCLVDKVKESYVTRNKIYIPEDVNELKSILQEIVHSKKELLK